MEFGGGKLPEKLTRTVLQYPNLVLKLHVKLKTDNGIFHSEFAYGNNSYINITAQGFLTLEIPKTKDNNEYNPTKSFLIGVGNIGNVVKRFKKVLNSIYTQEIFAIQNNKVISYEDMVKKYTEQITIPRIGQALLIKPSVIYDENETSYEGVNIYVNNSNNIIQLSIDEFENFVYLLDKFDIFNASQLLLNYYISYLSSKDKLNQASHKNNYTQLKNIDWGNNTSKTTSNYRKEESSNIFDGLNQ